MNENEALKLHETYKTPPHILDHCRKVYKVAKKIGEAYIRKGINIDINSLLCAALLHDIMRIIDIDENHYKSVCEKYYNNGKEIWDNLRLKYSGKTHCNAAFELLDGIGERKIAVMIRKHRFDAVLDTSEMPFTLEEEILTYADKRVLHAKIVTLDERFKDGIKRYNPDRINIEYEKKVHDKYYDLEKKLFKGIDLEPEDIC